MSFIIEIPDQKLANAFLRAEQAKHLGNGQYEVYKRDLRIGAYVTVLCSYSGWYIILDQSGVNVVIIDEIILFRSWQQYRPELLRIFSSIGTGQLDPIMTQIIESYRPRTSRI